MIIVTGGAGFIGSNIIKGLNKQGIDDILVVDNLANGVKFTNLADCAIADYRDKLDFIATLKNGTFKAKVSAVFHLGACSSTTEWDGRYIMHNNYDYSKTLLHFCLQQNVAFLYASSASVYGDGTVFKEDLRHEKPINMYAYSKFQFDQYVRRLLPSVGSQVVGFRYFNVYGAREQHKGTMASVAFHFNQQVKESGVVRLFQGCDGYGDGEQQRDFVYVADAVAVNVWFLQHPEKSGIFNLGTGQAQSFNEVARAVLAWHGRGKIEYIPFPAHLMGRYQSFTQADIRALRATGYDQPFHSVAQGVKSYLDILNGQVMAQTR